MLRAARPCQPTQELTQGMGVMTPCGCAHRVRANWHRPTNRAHPQAINLGIMGGMSVTDVRFIVECYNAERERMRQGAVAANAAAQMPLPPTPSTLTSHLGSPSPSMASSAADSGERALKTTPAHLPSCCVLNGGRASMFVW